MYLPVYLVVVYLCSVLCMAFFTLLERKILGYIQLRKGPNKVGYSGLVQPLADVLKLLTKEWNKPSFANTFVLFLGPVLGLMLAFFLWSISPLEWPSSFVAFSSVAFLCVSSMNVYSTLLSGWASNSKYALLGSLRAIAQTISYEVSMALILLSALILVEGLELNGIMKSSYWVFVFSFPGLCCWLVTCLAETNRTPFDFAEGESEIVSGFNVEYSAGPLAFIFMAEYMNMIFMSKLSVVIFLGVGGSIISSGLYMFFIFLLICARGSLPRMRYDALMGLTWKVFLPFSLIWFMFSVLAS